jgi:branched-chain amino acid transport system ATP-binding protein
MLRIAGLRITYGNAVEAVRDLSLEVPEGAIVALLGANGAGKSTVLKAISGVLAAEGGRIAGGDITFEGASLRGIRADDAVRRGIVQVPEGRRLFARLTVAENLAIGGFLRTAAERAAMLARLLDMFPPLHDKLDRAAGLLSGGSSRWWRSVAR